MSRSEFSSFKLWFSS